MSILSAEGFIVHAYRDSRRNKIHVLGRLTDGRGFAASFPVPEPMLFIRKIDAPRARGLFEKQHVSAECVDSRFRSFDGQECAQVVFSGKPAEYRAVRILRQEKLPVFGTDKKDAVSFLVRNGIRGGVRISGEWRPGKSVPVVFVDPEITAAHKVRAPLAVLSLDIETAVPEGTIRAVAVTQLHMACAGGTEGAGSTAGTGSTCDSAITTGIAAAGTDAATDASQRPSGRKKCILFNGIWSAPAGPDPEISVYADERSLLEALVLKIREFDPDIITGWNIIDFDFPRLDEAFARNCLDFALGRSVEAGHFFPAETTLDAAGASVKRSASVFLPGRQVLDGLRLVRTGYESFESYTLDAVANQILGRGKTVKVTDGEKLAELDRLYAGDTLSFCRYCLNDADLVLDILEKRNVLEHTVERSALTGAGIDKAWTSVASFERVYAEGLYARGVLEPELDASRHVSGAAGGTVLDPLAGIFRNVAVFDFRSLYPSVIRTFNIDPLAYERALRSERNAARAGELEAVAGSDGQDSSSRGDILPDVIRAPNGASFVRDSGILPELIGEYFSERLAAIDRGDTASAFVYKILMNSFYGVLGARNCRYSRTELAGAITSFGRMCLLFARDFFRDRGYRVIYGDTDSVFVEMPAEIAGAGNHEDSFGDMAAALNAALAARIDSEYRLESSIGIRFEKLYRKFFIPRLRSDEQDTERGRAKGYAGLLVKADGETEVDIKGMEAARSDYTPLTQRFQRELLAHLFRDDGTGAAERYIKEQTVGLYRGLFDGELVFRKKLRREPESYTASTPPHVKVARALGWTHRRGTVEYLMTVNGPEALSMLRSPVDYAWYASTQLLPVARSAGLVAGFDADAIINTLHSDGQLEFSWEKMGEAADRE